MSTRHRAMRTLLAILFAGALMSRGAAYQNASVRPALPADPIAAILEAFQSHDLVALGEGAHGNVQGHAFRLSLIRDPRFSAAVHDLVVEFGNARYQDVMDRFVQGDNVPDTALREVWQDTTQVTTVWDKPIYEEFFRAVRTVNTTLPPERRLRVLLGDPPVDWNTVQSFEDLNKSMVEGNRDRHPADVIRREVLTRHRRALIIYGESHLFRVPLGPSITQNLESSGIKLFTIASPGSMPTAIDLKTLQPDVASWRVPSIAILGDTVLGAAAFTSYFPFGPKIPERWRGLPMRDQFDAVLYLGDPSAIAMSVVPAARCADSSYVAMRLRRLALVPPPLSKIQMDRFKEECSATAPR